MGVERAVTRWYARRQEILTEIALLEEKLQSEPSPGERSEAGQIVENTDNEQVDIRSALAKAQEKLRLLGPCPKPMMG
jgi:hypothetical protein